MVVLDSGSETSVLVVAVVVAAVVAVAVVAAAVVDGEAVAVELVVVDGAAVVDELVVVDYFVGSTDNRTAAAAVCYKLLALLHDDFL